MSNFEVMLTGGHPNSLGKTLEVVAIVLAEPRHLEILYKCYSSDDEVVRMRTSNAMKRIQAKNPELLLSYIDRFIAEVSKIDQASAQWTLAQLFRRMAPSMKQGQRKKAETILKRNLATHTDWIVLNMTMDTLSFWAKEKASLRMWLRPHLERLSTDERGSVAKKAKNCAAMLDSL
ncbi:MAG: hypothetical protein GKS03_16425 [Alphaproteobacteria bacterium]|nr:hypothetical protein [Alphaproteobacteria bacterium]